jgi:hypothetical protein
MAKTAAADVFLHEKGLTSNEDVDFGEFQQGLLLAVLMGWAFRGDVQAKRNLTLHSHPCSVLSCE